MRPGKMPQLSVDAQAALAERFWAKIDKRAPTECWDWRADTNPLGYGRVALSDNGRFMIRPSHRVAWFLTHGTLSTEERVLHRCDRPVCCNPAHLFLGTIADNNRDMYAKGRRASFAGSANPLAKLTEDQVVRILARLREGARRRIIATEFGVSPALIRAIDVGEAWTHVAREEAR